MYRFYIPVLAFSVLLVHLGAHSAAAQNGLDSMLRQLGEQAIGEIVRPDPPPVTAPSTTTPRPQAPTASAGPTQSEVMEVQQLLGQLGYDPGVPDGLMGPNTARAISAFQRDAGARQTGAVTDALITDLRAKANRRGDPIRTTSQRAEAPSFDCTRAGTAVEHAICKSSLLAQKDRQLASLYSRALSTSAAPDAVRLRQRSWLQEREGCGGTEACLAAVMDTRIAELRGGNSVPSTTPVQDTTETRQRTKNDTVTASGSEGITNDAASGGTPVRDDGIRVHPSGRLLVPDPRFQSGSPGYWQHLALARHLKHAAIGEFPDDLVPSDNSAMIADAARDYLALQDIRQFFCTEEEMTNRQPDCMTFSDAGYAFAMGGGTFGNGAVEARKPNPFLWWRGANEFERRRSITEFLDSGVRERISETAPETPVRLLFTIEGVLDTYDFDAGNFSVLVGLDTVEVPGSNSIAFEAEDVAQPISAPRGKAEALQQMLESRSDGRAKIVIGVEVDITPDQPRGGQPRWRSEVVSSNYFMDVDATVPLSGVIGEGQQTDGTASATAEPATADQTTAGLSGSVLRSLDLRREDGRIVLGFDGYREPTESTEEAVTHLVASASRDLLKPIAEDHNRHNMPLLRAMLRQDLRDRLLGGEGSAAPFAGETEFEVRRAKAAFESEVAPALVAEAPPLPIPMRLYLDATLSGYDFEKERIGLRVFQEQRLRIGGSYPISLEPIFDLVPGALPMAPDAAERLVNAADAGPGPVLRLDFDVMTTRLERVHFLMTARPAAVALVTGENRDVIHYQESFDTAEDAGAAADAARALLGPDPAEAVVTSRPSDYPVLGVAPRMDMKTAVDGLSRHFSDAEIEHADNLLRAERGWCNYDSVESDNVVDAQGAVCFAARVKDGRISRVALQKVVSTGVTGELLQEHRDAFGEHASRWDRNAPAGSLSREILGWGEEIDRDRTALGRDSIDMVPREAELDIVYLSPQVSVLTLRADAAASKAPSATDSGAATSAPGADGGPTPDSSHKTERVNDFETAALGL